MNDGIRKEFNNFKNPYDPVASVTIIFSKKPPINVDFSDTHASSLRHFPGTRENNSPDIEIEMRGHGQKTVNKLINSEEEAVIGAKMLKNILEDEKIYRGKVSSLAGESQVAVDESHDIKTTILVKDINVEGILLSLKNLKMIDVNKKNNPFAGKVLDALRKEELIPGSTKLERAK